MKSIFWFIPILFLSVIVFGQQVVVTQLDDGETIPGVLVVSLHGEQEWITNGKGQVTLSDLAEDDTLIFQHYAFKSELVTLGNLAKANYRVALAFKNVFLEPTTLTAERIPESATNVSNKITTLKRQEIEQLSARTTAELLERSGEVFVQQSQMGGGSPVLRGFEANKVLLVLDGVRLNNAIYRSGHVQNIISIDQGALDRAEVVFGPGSLIYGSDALGGVMHFVTKTPMPHLGKGSNTQSGTLVTKLGSAASSSSSHFDIAFTGKNFSSFTSTGFSHFEDLRTGGWRSPAYPNFGTRPDYVDSYLSGDTWRDSIVQNPDPNRLVGTGYEQLNVQQKLIYAPSSQEHWIANVMYSTTSDVPRYDKLTERKGDGLKFAEWNYGPQKHLLTSLAYQMATNTAVPGSIRIQGSYQRINEERVNRKFNDSERTHRNELVDVYAFNFDIAQPINERVKYLVGTAIAYNDVKSIASTEHINTGDVGVASTRYPNGGSKMLSAGVYAKVKAKLSRKFKTAGGIRFSHVGLFSEFEENRFYEFPFDEINFNNQAVTGSLELIYLPSGDDKTKISWLASSGFRSPNVDDYGKVFENNGIVVVPRDGVKPEKLYSTELNFKKIFNNKVSIGLNGYTSLLNDAIVRQDYAINGSDSLLYEGEWFPIQANINADRAVVYGATGIAEAVLNNYFDFKSTLTYTKGKDISNGVPLAHIPPIYGLTSVTYHHKKWRSVLDIRYNDWKNIEDYSPSSEDNLFDATEDGMPGWYTLNWQVQYRLFDNFKATVGVDNMLDRHYRTFASGVSAPGRNLWLSLRGKF